MNTAGKKFPVLFIVLGLAACLAVCLAALWFVTHRKPAPLQSVAHLSAAEPVSSESPLSEVDFDRPCAAPLVESAASAATPGLIAPAMIDNGQAGEPDYPPDAKQRNQQGRVVVRIVINENGQVAHANLDTSSGFTDLDNAALRYTSRMNYRPARRNGDPVCYAKKMAVKYVLKQ